MVRDSLIAQILCSLRGKSCKSLGRPVQSNTSVHTHSQSQSLQPVHWLQTDGMVPEFPSVLITVHMSYDLNCSLVKHSVYYTIGQKKKITIPSFSNALKNISSLCQHQISVSDWSFLCRESTPRLKAHSFIPDAMCQVTKASEKNVRICIS